MSAMMPGGHELGRDDATARLRALTDVAKVASAQAGRGDVLSRTVRAARVALEGASISLSIWERDHGHLRCIVNEGELAPIELPEPVDEVYSLSTYPYLSVLLDRATGYVRRSDLVPADAFVRLLRELGKGSCIGVPVQLEGRIWGEMFVTRRIGDVPFTEDDLDFATTVAALLGAALATAEHVETVSRLAYIDPLTGLANRRAVDERLDQSMADYMASGANVSLVVSDVNGLKRLNDEQGHDVGDRALVRYAGLLSAAASLAPGSLAGRLGGDEFCIVISGGDAEAAVRVAEDLCHRASIELEDGVSCGVASTADDVGSVNSAARLFRLADAAQYRAKRSGSHRPIVAGRNLPAEARMSNAPVAATADSDADTVRDRRSFRGRTHADPGRLVDIGLAALDHGDMPGAQARLEVVAEAVAVSIDAIGWWISECPVGASALTTRSFAMYRVTGVDVQPGPGGGLGRQFELADYPLSAAAVAGGGHVVEVDDAYADPAEVALLDGMSCVAVMLAGGWDTRSGSGWLVEVFADEISLPLRGMVGSLRALVAVALSGPT